MSRILCNLLLSIIFTASAFAGDINWNCSSNSTNYTSAGAPNVLGTGFVFELGAFNNGFIPNAANVGQWADNWVALDRAAYNPVSRFFTSRASVTNNLPPFNFGGEAYMWGFNDVSPGEWILMKNPTWRWPFASGFPSPPLNWSVASADTEAVIGVVNDPGFQMMTTQVSEEPPDVGPSAWQHQFFNASERLNPAISGWDADPDCDGANNLTELAAGTNPRSASETPVVEAALVEAGSGTRALEIRLARNHRAAITYRARVSTNLNLWSSIGMTVESDTLTEIVLRFPSNADSQFIRFEFEL